MASKHAVAAALGLLSRVFGGAIDEVKVTVYYDAWDDLDDAQLERAVRLYLKTSNDRFIPPPGVIRAMIAPAVPVVDPSRLLARISRLGHYNPSVGWIYPSADKVREELGEPAAYAYLAGGGPRVFSDNETTHDIALREFGKAMIEAAKRPDVELPVIGAGGNATSIGPNQVRALISETAAGMSIERARRNGTIGAGERDAAD
jgi:hypothetical protein